MNLVLDSSVIAKLFIDEEDSNKAMELLEKCSGVDIELISSDLIFYEVGNTILKHLRGREEDGGEYMRQLFSLDIEYRPLDQSLAREALKIGKAHNVTYYDAIHVALSQQCKSPLVTEDRELLKKLGNALSVKDALESIV